MTTPGWQQRLTDLQAIGTGRSLPTRPPGSIALTSAHLDELLGQNANPFCGPEAEWWFTRDDWPFRGRPGLWGKAEKLSKEQP